ncbi:sensor histidine kinase [Sphingosinicella sp. BN140058]|uniref:sensor histidine kinase n=1 Tax=Sphingosinicella sp. BN140058 TaxID=1892855 RepID=UPI00197FA8E7|nr:ATP-binding protein [Sphingosinicella sp. BN140058]
MDTIRTESMPVPEILPPLLHAGNREGAVASAGILHDLGNLMQIASSAINILLRSPRMPAAHSGPILRRARLSLEQAGAIIRQTIERERHGASAPEFGTDIGDCLEDLAALVEVMDEPDLRLEIEAEPGLRRMHCDPVGLRRAVLNLVLNARDAMTGNGTILIRVRMQGSMIELSVADHGIGMSPATLARAFGPFFTTKASGSSGLGLPMVARLMRDAGGEVSIESEPGIGTVVTLRLPAMAGAETQRKESHP